MALLEVQDLKKAYRDAGAENPVLKGASFAIERGETISIVGSSGAGKSTLLAILAGLLLPDSGSVSYDGAELTRLDETGRAGLRARRIGIVLQSDNLIPFLTAAENVELAVTLAGGEDGPARARRILGDLGVGDRCDDLPRRLSGGEAQRVALAVALVNEPDLLLADEVTAELDSTNAERVVELVIGAARERGLSVLMVTHSPELAKRTDEALEVVDGRMVAM